MANRPRKAFVEEDRVVENAISELEFVITSCEAALEDIKNGNEKLASCTEIGEMYYAAEMMWENEDVGYND